MDPRGRQQGMTRFHVRMTVACGPLGEANRQVRTADLVRQLTGKTTPSRGFLHRDQGEGEILRDVFIARGRQEANEMGQVVVGEALRGVRIDQRWIRQGRPRSRAASALGQLPIVGGRKGNRLGVPVTGHGVLPHGFRGAPRPIGGAGKTDWIGDPGMQCREVLEGGLIVLEETEGDPTRHPLRLGEIDAFP